MPTTTYRLAFYFLLGSQNYFKLNNPTKLKLYEINRKLLFEINHTVFCISIFILCQFYDKIVLQKKSYQKLKYKKGIQENDNMFL